MNLKKKRFLIIGGTGFIGYSLAKTLLHLKGDVSSLSTKKPVKIRKLSKVKYFIGNIKNLRRLKSIFKNTSFDYIINCGGYVEHLKKKEIHNNHYIGCVNLFKIFKNTNLKLFIQIGSSTEYGDTRVPHKENFSCKPNGFYGKTKLKATKFFLEQFKKNGFPVSIIRLYQVYGPNQDYNRFIPQLIKSSILKKKFVTSEGKQFRDFLFIEDAIEAIIRVLKSRNVFGEIFNIGYGKGIQLRKIMNIIKKKNSFLKPDFGRIKIRPDEKFLIFPNIEKSKKLIFWKPKTSINKGLDITNKFYIKQLKKKDHD